MREATPAEWESWNQLISDTPAGHSFFELREWAAMKEPTWRPRPMVHQLPWGELPVLYLERRVPFFGTYWYAAGGPRVLDVADLRAVCEDLRHGPAFTVMMELPIPATGPDSKRDVCDQVPGLHERPVVGLNASTVVVDLDPSEDELLASFKQRTRRTLRKADKAGAVIEHIEDESVFDDFWALYQTTVRRNDIHVRPKEYYVHSWRTWLEAGKGHFVMARPHAGAPYAAGDFLWTDQEWCFYKDGGSLRIPEANGLQYLVQWESMRWAKEQGYRHYDMYGMPPSWSLDDESHRMHGLVQFKTGFGEVLDTVGTVEFRRSPRMSQLWEEYGIRAWRLWGRARGRNATFL